MDEKLTALLATARQDAGLKQSDVGKLIGVKGNTISDWERGRTEPDIDTFIELCNIYKINVADILFSAYGDIPGDDFLCTKAELTAIQKYRKLDDHGKHLVKMVLEAEYNRYIAQPQPETTEKAVINPLQIKEKPPVQDKEKSEEEKLWEEKPYLMPIAAHADDLSDEQLELIRQDLDDM